MLGVHTNHRLQRIGYRLGDRHLRAFGDQRHRLTELRGKFFTPGASGDQQLLGAVLATVAGRHMELPTDLLHCGHLGALLNYRPSAPRSTGKGRRGQSRVGVTVVRRIGAALDLRAEEGKTFVQFATAIDAQIQFARLGRRGVRL
ncbi:hypothetical protein FQZ97_732340 [compost metagenome]